MKKKALPLQEWFILLVVLGFLSTLVVISTLTNLRIKNLLALAPPQIENAKVKEIAVQIEGEVVNPGIYSSVSGVILEKILKKAKPKRNADLSALDKEEKILHSCVIHIPKLEKIIVTIEGAVANPGRLEVPVNSRFRDLKGKIFFLENADLRGEIFKKRRFLKQGEVIYIPFSEKKKK